MHRKRGRGLEGVRDVQLLNALFLEETVRNSCMAKNWTGRSERPGEVFQVDSFQTSREGYWVASRYSYFPSSANGLSGNEWLKDSEALVISGGVITGQRPVSNC